MTKTTQDLKHWHARFMSDMTIENNAFYWLWITESTELNHNEAKVETPHKSTRRCMWYAQLSFCSQGCWWTRTVGYVKGCTAKTFFKYTLMGKFRTMANCKCFQYKKVLRTKKEYAQACSQQKLRIPKWNFECTI